MLKADVWILTNRADPIVAKIADRHYNRQSIGSPQYAPPGRCLVLRTSSGDAFWITSWPFAQYVKHAWAGAFVCSAFRNEGPVLSSSMIVEAVRITRWATDHTWRTPVHDHGFITFVDRDKTKPKRDPGRCFRKAGFADVGETAGGLVALQLSVAMLTYFPPLVPRGGSTLLL